MKLPGFLTGQLWKVGTIGAGLVAMVLMVLLLSAQHTAHDLTKQRNELTAKIEDPKTGYVARLTQANQNVAVLETGIAQQKIKMEEFAAENARTLASTRAQLAAAQAESKTANERLRKFMSKPPQGATALDRVNDIDQRVLEDLNHAHP